MTQTNELDIGPLTWVKSEIDQALTKATESIGSAGPSPEDRPHIQFAQTHLHQARGALSIVGLDGLTRFAESLDQLLGMLARGEVPFDERASSVVRRSLAVIGNYLEELVHGSLDQPLRLYPLYTQIAELRGTTATEAELFFPDLGRRPPRRASGRHHLPNDKTWLNQLRTLRGKFERCLLQWLRHPDDVENISTMRETCTEIETLQNNPANTALWWVAQGFFDALRQGDISADAPAKHICAALAKELRQQMGSSRNSPDRLMRELLFQISRVPARNDLQQQIRQIWSLDSLWPDPGSTLTEIPLAPLLKGLRSELAAAKNDWDEFCDGKAAALQGFDTRLQQLTADAGKIGRPAMVRLFAGISEVAQWLRKDPLQFNTRVAIEVATALLLAEVALDGGVTEAEFATQVNDTLSRLGALLRGDELPPAESSATVEAARRNQEREARTQVTREMLTNLAQVEQALDDYFRNHAKTAPLAGLSAPMGQIEGALALIGGEEAIPLLHSASETVARLATGGQDPAQEELETLARNLSALGFYINALQHGHADLQEFLDPSRRSDESGPVEEFVADFEEFVANFEEPAAEQETAHEPSFDEGVADITSHAETTQAPPSPPEPEPEPESAPIEPEPATQAPVDEALDEELLAIFIEEAHEVLGNIVQELSAIRSGGDVPSALTSIRRGFHTLKGSGRMVGLSELGEAAWGLEQTLNRWLQLEWRSTPALGDLIQTAYETFEAWVHQIESGQGLSRDVTALLQSAESLRTISAPHEVPTPVEEAIASSPESEVLAIEAETAVSETSDANESDVVSSDETRTADEVVAHDEGPESDESEKPVTDHVVSEQLSVGETSDEKSAEPDTSFPVLEELPLSDAEALTTDRTPSGSETGAHPESVEDELEISGEVFEFLDLERPADSSAAPAPVEADGDSATFDFGDLEERELEELDLLEPETALPSSDASDTGAPADLVIPEQSVEASGEELLPSAQDEEAAPAAATADSAAQPTAQEPAHIRLGEAEISRQLFELYVSEARDHIATLHDELRNLSTNPTHLPSEAALRAAHTLAGISGTARIPPLRQLARSLENAIERLQQGEKPPTTEQADLIRASVEQLDAMLAEVAGGRLPLALPELDDQIDQIGRDRPVDPGIIPESDTGQEREAPTPAPAMTDRGVAEAEPATPVHDDVDDQLLPIFMEEASELMSSLHALARSWQEKASDEQIQSALRLLHTLKGSARMTGAMRLGEHVHAMESRLESATITEPDPTILVDDLVAGLDHAEQLVAALTGQGQTEAIEAIEADRSAPATATDGESVTIETAQDGAESATSATMRIRAEALDRFVNEAGEIGISRTRVEGELRTVRRSLLDLTENVIRLRNQLREVELQAETQMQSRIAQADSAHGEFDPLEMDRYTRLQELTRMMAESVGDVTTIQQNLFRNLDGAELALHAQGRLARELQQALMQVRMVPFDSLADRLHRVVRQSAKDLGKRANLDIRGGRIEVDRGVLERMTAPLEHLLRNAVAHGIESRELRREAGKDEIGQITLSVSHVSNEIVITLTDDGGGLDYAAITARARERGLLAGDEVADERRLTNLIFTPGFTTAETVSTIAGRGVGMDVVKAEAAAVGGRIDVQASAGKGTEFRISLPLTLAVTQALLVHAAHVTYAIPSNMIAQVLELKTDGVERIRSEGGIEWQGQFYAYRYLPQLLGYDAKPEPQRFNWMLLLRAGAQSLALHVDALRGNQEIVVKNAGPQLVRIVGISGATVLGDGEIVLILNPLALANRPVPTPKDLQGSPELDGFEIAEQPARVATVMIVDDSLTVRKITGRLLEREGYIVVTAKDGADALEQLTELTPDVILSDIEMPRMDGFDLVRNLRSDDRTSNIPVIMITSRLADKHRQYAEKLGVNEYLGKPYDEEELLRLVRHYATAPVAVH